MKILCIEKSDKSNKIKELLNCVERRKNKTLIYSNLEKCNMKTKQKIVIKLQKIIKKEHINKVILSKEIKKDKDFINLLHSNNINICNDRWIFKRLVFQVIDQIMNGKKKQESEIWITVNDVDSVTQNIIYLFSKKFKRINIITNHINRFKTMEEKLYNEDGIMITITNNRRRSLLKANLILNIDFPKEVLNQFAIYDEATIVNLEGNMFIKKKRFNGRVINDIKIKSFEDNNVQEFIEKYDLSKYDIKDICEVLNIVPKCDIILVS